MVGVEQERHGGVLIGRLPGNYYEAGSDPATLAAAIVRQMVDQGTVVQLVQTGQQSATSSHDSLDDGLPGMHCNLLRSKRRPREYGRKAKPFVITLRPWLVSKLWLISVSRSQAGWDANIRTWNVVPSNSPIFRLARKGDLRGIQRLVDSGQASPFDVDEYGENIAQVSNGRYGVIIFTDWFRLVCWQGSRTGVRRQWHAISWIIRSLIPMSS